MVDSEEVVFSLESRVETRFSVSKIVQQLSANGLKRKSLEMRIKYPDTLIQTIHGYYPGGQEVLNSKIEEIRLETGPCVISAQFDPFEFTSDGDVRDKLKEFGFRIVAQKSSMYELEYQNGCDEAYFRLGDALLELFAEKTYGITKSSNGT